MTSQWGWSSSIAGVLRHSKENVMSRKPISPNKPGISKLASKIVAAFPELEPKKAETALKNGLQSLRAFDIGE